MARREPEEPKLSDHPLAQKVESLFTELRELEHHFELKEYGQRQEKHLREHFPRNVVIQTTDWKAPIIGGKGGPKSEETSAAVFK